MSKASFIVALCLLVEMGTRFNLVRHLQRKTQDGVLFTRFADSNELGDRQIGLYEYKWGSRKVVLKKLTPEFNLSQDLRLHDGAVQDGSAAKGIRYP